MNLKELKQWYTFTDVNVKNYFDRILRTTIHTNESETETDALLLDWSRVDVKATELNERKQRPEYFRPCAASKKQMHQLICFWHVQILNA